MLLLVPNKYEEFQNVTPAIIILRRQQLRQRTVSQSLIYKTMMDPKFLV